MMLISKIRNYFKPKPVDVENSFTWQYVDLDHELVKEIQSIYLKVLPRDTQYLNFFQVANVKIPDILGVKVVYPGLIYCSGNSDLKYAHKDPTATYNAFGTPNEYASSSFALNIPLINCGDSVTTLYEDSKHSILANHKDTIAEVINLDKATVITSYVLDNPILFNTQVFHCVKNNSSEPRLAISLRFDRNPTEWIIKK